jgi:Domain of unknown function (DUF4386)
MPPSSSQSGCANETPACSRCCGRVLEIIVALAGIGTAIFLYVVVKRQNEALAMGFVGTRTLKAATIFIGVADS